MTALLVVLTVTEIVLFVGVLAYFLVRIAASLQRTSSNLAKVSFGVRAIETQCSSIGPSVTRVNEQLTGIAAALGTLDEVARGGADAGRVER